MFNLGNVRKHQETIDMQEEMIDNLYIERANLIKANTDLQLKAVRLEKANHSLREKLGKKRKPRRKQLGHKTGYKAVGKEEHITMWEMYNNGVDPHRIATTLDRSVSCVSNHIQQEMDLQNGK